MTKVSGGTTVSGEGRSIDCCEGSDVCTRRTRTAGVARVSWVCPALDARVRATWSDLERTCVGRSYFRVARSRCSPEPVRGTGYGGSFLHPLRADAAHSVSVPHRTLTHGMCVPGALGRFEGGGPSRWSVAKHGLLYM